MILEDIERSDASKCSIAVRRLYPLPDAACLTEVFSRQKQPAILGGTDLSTSGNRQSVFACRPGHTFRFCTEDTNPTRRLRQILARYTLDRQADCPLAAEIFKGGWIGFFSYDLGRHFETIESKNDDDPEMPLIHLAFYDHFIVVDHVRNCAFLVAVEHADFAPADTRLDFLEELAKKAADMRLPESGPEDMAEADFSSVACNMDRDFYMAAIARTKQHIYDGDVYQINFSRRFSCEFTGDRPEVFRWLNTHNPSPYAAYLETDDFTAASASPEMFIRIVDGTIETEPIKGTRPRLFSRQPHAEKINRANIAELLASEKEKAELNMIIDLERNDLHRICVPGTVHVSQPRRAVAFPTVYHALANVSGKLRPELSFADILGCIFPGGSITGAPKIAAMNIIERLEPVRRGLYTGSIGYISIDSNVSLNIAIRTIIMTDSKMYFQTGGGIVADSDPTSEWDETEVKARALLACAARLNRKTE